MWQGNPRTARVELYQKLLLDAREVSRSIFSEYHLRFFIAILTMNIVSLHPLPGLSRTVVYGLAFLQ